MPSETEAADAAFEEAQAAAKEGNYERAREIINGLSDADVDHLLGVSEDLQEGNPDEELAAAIEELEPAAGEVAEAAIEAGRPDLAAEVVECTLATLADWAESAEELAETLEDVAAEIEDETAQEVASDAADTTDAATEAVEETLEEAGVPAVVAEMETDPAIDTEFVADVAPEPSHWLLRRRKMRV